MALSDSFKRILKPHSKTSFLYSLHPKARILDIGCGNSSCERVRRILPNCFYVGVDILENSASPMMNEFILSSPDSFADDLSHLSRQSAGFNAVISSHNIEHCFDRESVLNSVSQLVLPGGKLFLSFPSSSSVKFPSRKGTLNYSDDPTHVLPPPDFRFIVDLLTENGFYVDYASPDSSTLLSKSLGFLFEPISRLRGTVLPFTWDYYGFESLVIASKLL